MLDPSAVTVDAVTRQRDAFVGRIASATTAMWELATIYLGERLGLYTALDAAGASTSAELATRTGTAERYVREWLEQQTVAGILEVEDATAQSARRRYRLPAGHREALVDRDSLNYMAAQARTAVGLLRPVAALPEAFRHGTGVPFEEYGPDLIEGMADGNRTEYLQKVASEWLPKIPDVHARLTSDRPARVADIGCGGGWVGIAIARGYPSVRVDGFDLDTSSIALAQANAVAAGVADRVTFQVRDASDPDLAGRYDLVLAVGCVHDMARPAEALRAMRRLAGEQGAIIVADPKVGEGLADDLYEGNEVERFIYSASVLHCLPIGMAEQPSAATGMAMHPATLRSYARDAGFRDIEILPIEAAVWRFYRLTV